MLKYPCLVLDHDDTVVRSEATVNHPFFVEFLKKHRPGDTISLHDYISDCYEPGYIEMCRRRFHFTDEELNLEYHQWKEHIRSHIPDPYPGIGDLLKRYRAAGGIICVVSQSAQENILRDYRVHFDMEPDMIFGWDLEPEHRKPSPYALYQIMDAYNLSPSQLLVVDDMKPACAMARAVGAAMAFAGWDRQDHPDICREMESLCDYCFASVEEMEHFLFASCCLTP